MMRLADHLLATPLDQLGARERQVIERAVRRHREPIADASLPTEKLTFGNRLADRVAAVGGSWGFISCFGLALVSWTALNSLALSQAFDPYPFIFLNLLLRCSPPYRRRSS